MIHDNPPEAWHHGPLLYICTIAPAAQDLSKAGAQEPESTPETCSFLLLKDFSSPFRHTWEVFHTSKIPLKDSSHNAKACTASVWK